MASPKQLAVINTDYHEELIALVNESHELVIDLLNMRNRRMITDYDLNDNYGALKWAVDKLRERVVTYEAVYELKQQKLKERAGEHHRRYAGNPVRNS